MEMVQEQLINKREVRDEFINRLEVLDKVKKLLLLEGIELATTEQVASYYEVSKELVYMTVSRNIEELSLDGYKVFFKDNLLTNGMLVKTKRGGFDIIGSNNNIIASGSNKGIALFTKRSILRVGMLLRDSEVAQEVRTQLLNIVEEVPKEKQIKHIDKENSLLLGIIGSTDKLEQALAIREYKQYKDRHIEQLQNENNLLKGEIQDWNIQGLINRLVRKISWRVFKGSFDKGWDKLYGTMYYRYNIGIRKRISNCKHGKGKATIFDVLYPNEIHKALQCAIQLCKMYNIDITEEMIHITDSDKMVLEALPSLLLEER